MKDNLPKVSVIVPVYNGEATIGHCLNHLLQQHYPSEKLEIIVVDNGSTDNTVQIIESLGLKSYYAARKGPAAARNEGMKIASGEIMIFLDADCLADPDLVIRHTLKYFYFEVVDPGVMMIGGGIVGYNTNYWSLCDDFCCWFLNQTFMPGRYIEFNSTANLSLRSELITKGYFFDEELKSCEDIDLCTRVTRDGYKIYFEPGAIVTHINRTKFRGFMKHCQEWTQTYYTLIQKGTEASPAPQSLIYRKDLQWWQWPGWKFYPFWWSFKRLGGEYVQVVYWIIRLALSARRYQVIWCIPFIILNKGYFNYLRFKTMLRFCNEQRELNSPKNNVAVD